MSDNTGFDVAQAPASEPLHEAASKPAFGEGGPAAPRSTVPPLASSSEDEEEVLEVEPEPLEPPPSTGFQAFLQHVNLHNLLQIESMSRTTGVFQVVSATRRGYLHLASGDLIHAETDGLSPEAAAAEILSWGHGEFSSSARPLAAARTIQVSLQALLLRLAKAADEAAQGHERSSFDGMAEELLEEDLEELLPDDDDDGEPMTPLSQLPPVAPVGSWPAGVAAARQTPPPPRGSRPPPAEPAPAATQVVISALGEVTEGSGPALDELSARAAYAARLAELIGRAIRSGTPRSLELRGKGTQTLVRWQTDGGLEATFDAVSLGSAPGGKGR